jgi:hypothetical protein
MSRYRRCSNRLAVVCVALAGLALLLTPAVSRAGLIDFFDYAMHGSSGAISWPDTTWLHESDKPDVNLYYAVFTMAAFEEYFQCDLPGTDPYVYAYQMVNATTSPQAISQLSVGLYSGATVAGVGQVDDPIGAVGTVAKTARFSTGYASADWFYSTNGGYQLIPVGGKSKILIFTSSHSPADGKLATVKGTTANGEAGEVATPSSVPEPSSLLFLTIAGFAFVLFGRFRSILS